MIFNKVFRHSRHQYLRLFLLITVFSCQTTKVSVNWEEEASPQTVVEEEAKTEEKKEKDKDKKEDKEGKSEVRESEKKLPEGHIDSRKESKKFKHKEPVSLSGKMLKKLDGEWLPVEFFQELEKKQSLLEIALFPPVPGILIRDGKVDIFSASGKKKSAIASSEKQGELVLTTKEHTYRFSVRNNELIWTVGKQKISYRRVKNNNYSFNTLMNNAMIAGTYFSMLTRTLITFRADGSISGMGWNYTNYRFPENQKELERSRREFDVIYLYHKKRPSAGRWFALVWDERNNVRVIARIRETEGGVWQLSSNVYMLMKHD